MKINNLEEGMIIKNYKELCHVLEIKPKSGRDKNNQLNILSQACEYERSGNQFKIIKVDKEKDINKIKQLEKLKKRGVRYIDDIEVLILSMLIKEHKGEMLISKTKLLRELTMVNKNYHFCKTRTNKLSAYLDIDQTLISEWYGLTDKMLQGNLTNAINRLTSRSLIDCNTVRMVCEQVADEPEIFEHIIVDEYDEEHKRYYEQSGCRMNFRLATDEESSSILRYEGEYKNGRQENDIIAKGEWQEYREYVNSRMLKVHKVSFYYNAYHIKYTPNNVRNVLDNINNCDEWEIRKTLNCDIIDNNMLNAVIRQQKYIGENGMVVLDIGYNRSNDKYIENNKTLNLNLIDKDNKSITIDIKGIKVNKQTTIDDKYIK